MHIQQPFWKTTHSTLTSAMKHTPILKGALTTLRLTVRAAGPLAVETSLRVACSDDQRIAQDFGFVRSRVDVCNGWVGADAARSHPRPRAEYHCLRRDSPG